MGEGLDVAQGSAHMRGLACHAERLGYRKWGQRLFPPTESTVRDRSFHESRLYGQKKPSDLLRHYPKRFELVDRGTPGHAKVLYVRALG